MDGSGSDAVSLPHGRPDWNSCSKRYHDNLYVAVEGPYAAS